MEFEKMTIEELEQRKAAIPAESEQEGADVDALLEELRGINAEIEKRKAEAAKREEIRSAVAGGAGTVIESVKEERKTMNIEELRNSAEYIDAYAEFIKTENDTQLRALLSENGEGKVAVPTVVMETIKTAWDREEVLRHVRKTYLKGNVKVGFEISATGAVVHTEGAAAPAEETLTLGIVEMVPASIKKWITVSDEALDLRGSAFLSYIYSELTYQIAKKAADMLVEKITTLTASATATAPGVAVVTAAPAMGTVAKAIAALSDEASNPVIIMNKQTWANFKAIQYANGYGADPFEGLTVAFNNSLPAYDSASANDIYMIVGDLGFGAQMNFPAGEEITIKYDDMSLAEKDLVKMVGRMFVGMGVTANKAFTQVKKPASV